MNMLNQTEKGLLQEIAGISGFMPGSAFNLRANGCLLYTSDAADD